MSNVNESVTKNDWRINIEIWSFKGKLLLLLKASSKVGCDGIYLYTVGH